ncbi:unnamed protein product [Vicia faba]|uniref:Uncharacterized protein n=1 Tax=Vicia faba TaxID=3906 RepID=A0AAV0ZP85_VICFA|nr:unnamed protein product [Vicia faba]
MEYSINDLKVKSTYSMSGGQHIHRLEDTGPLFSAYLKRNLHNKGIMAERPFRLRYDKVAHHVSVNWRHLGHHMRPSAKRHLVYHRPKRMRSHPQHLGVLEEEHDSLKIINHMQKITHEGDRKNHTFDGLNPATLSMHLWSRLTAPHLPECVMRMF